MNRFVTRKYLLIGILMLAGFLRFWQLGSVPPSASMDEASIGYNAYSVYKTGVDEYGQFPFISQKGYDDWRRSTYLFLVVPFVALFNLNVIAVRLPAVILSLLTIFATYHLVLSLFPKRSNQSVRLALLAAFLLAISPWHIYISRLGHESNAYLSFFVFAVLFFLLGLKDKNKLLISIIFFTLSLVSYYAGQIIVPLFITGIVFVYRKTLISIVSTDKKIAIGLSICAFLLVPVFWIIFSPQSLIRFQGTSTFKPEAHWKEYSERTTLRNKAVASHDLIGEIFYNRRLFPVQVFAEGYLSHFNPKWLFTNSSAESFKVPNLGLLYIWEIPFIILGLFVLIFRHDLDQKVKKVILLWFILGPLPAAVATQTPHAMRAYAFLPTWQIFSALGLPFVFERLGKIKLLGVIVFLFIIFISLQSLYKNYFLIFPKEQSKSFLYALSKAMPFIISKENNYDRIIIANNDNLYQSYMLYLYYSRFDPRLYLKTGGTKSGGYAETHKIGKYEFRPIIWYKETAISKSLYVGNPADFPSDLQKFKMFYSLDSTPSVELVEFSL